MSNRTALPVGTIAERWWMDHFGGDENPADAPADPAGQREAGENAARRPRRVDAASRARLVRCDGPVDACSIPVALELVVRLDAARPASAQRDAHGPSATFTDRALGLAIVLAHVRHRQRSRQAPLQVVGYRRFPGAHPGRADEDSTVDRPVLSEIRFRRLMELEPDELMRGFIRLVHISDRTMDIPELARGWWNWGQDATRRRWAMDYYNVRDQDRSRSQISGEPT